MKTNVSADAPIACTLAAGEFKERLDWIAGLNREALLDARRQGLRLILTYRPDDAERIREMVRREQQCCAFLGFDLREDQDSTTLVITAPEGATGALDAIFEPFLAADSGERSATTARKGEDNGCC